jgi:predicted DNA-binding protein with PD1-like motif
MSTLKVGPQEYLVRVEQGVDLKAYVESLARRLGIKLAVVTCIGAVRRASLVYYDQERKVYLPPHEYNGPHEIVSCSGNISLKDGKEFAHLHMVLSDVEGRAFGGHVMSAEVFAAEVHLRGFEGELHREPDPATGLALWKIDPHA